MLSQNNFQLISKYVDRVAIYMFFITLLAFLMSFDAMETSLKSVGCSGLPSGNPGLGQQGWGMPCVTSHTYFAHSCVRSSLRRQVQVPWPLMRWWRICAQCSNDRWLCLNVILFSFRMSRRSREHILWTKQKVRALIEHASCAIALADAIASCLRHTPIRWMWKRNVLIVSASVVFRLSKFFSDTFKVQMALCSVIPVPTFLMYTYIDKCTRLYIYTYIQT